jgi:hypothetical protein
MYSKVPGRVKYEKAQSGSEGVRVPGEIFASTAACKIRPEIRTASLRKRRSGRDGGRRGEADAALKDGSVARSVNASKLRSPTDFFEAGTAQNFRSRQPETLADSAWIQPGSALQIFDFDLFFLSKFRLTRCLRDTRKWTASRAEAGVDEPRTFQGTLAASLNHVRFAANTTSTFWLLLLQASAAAKRRPKVWRS